jgi:hypothetical protein
VLHILAPMLRPLPALLVVLALSLLAAAPAQAKRHVPFGWLGVNADGGLMEGRYGAPEGEWDRIAASGGESVRLAVRWNQMQSSKRAAIDFATVDALVLGAARRGLEVLPVVQDTPRWAALHPHDGTASPPRDGRSAGRFLRALVARWGPRGTLWAEHPDVRPVPVRDWQVWNEPNFKGYWSVQPYAKTYVRLLRAAHRAIHAADPGARTVMAGLTNRSWLALRTLYAAGARGTFDVVALNTFTRRPRDVVRLARLARREMRRHHDARVPVWITELSWPASVGRIKSKGGFETDEAGQTAKLRSALTLLAAAQRRLRIGRVYWYTWLSSEGTQSAFDFSGLRRVRDDRVVDAPSLDAFRTSAATLEGCTKAPGSTRCG